MTKTTGKTTKKISGQETNPNEYELGIVERLNLNSILPKEESLLKQITAKSIRKKIEFSSDDLEKFEMRDSAQGVLFNPSKEEKLKVSFLDNELELIKETIELLDKNKKITPENLDLVLLFKNP